MDFINNQQRFKRGFTLVELMLVVVIMAMAAGIAVPHFAASSRNMKLKTASRSIVTSARYARSIAVLRQEQTALLIDTIENSVEVVALTVQEKQGGFLDEYQITDTDEALDAAEGNDLGSATVEQLRLTKIADTVEIQEITLGEKAEEWQIHDGIYTINFYPNGANDGFEMRLEDDRGKQVEIGTDPVTGRLTAENVD